MGRAPAIYRPMTEAERALSIALGGCAFPPATFSKRFARDISSMARASEPRITRKQLALLHKLVRRYRRQIRPSEIPASTHFLLDPEAPIPVLEAEAPLPLVRSDENGSRSDGRRETPVQPDQVEALPGQLSLDHVTEAIATECEKFHREGSQELARTLYAGPDSEDDGHG